MRALALVMIVACGAPASHHEHRVSFRTDVPELQPYVQKMAERLAKATGRPEVATPDGQIEVRINDHPTDAEGNPICARTVVGCDTGEALFIEVDLEPDPEGCGPLPQTLIHEGMHALFVSECGVDEHSDGGIFAAAPLTSYIDEASLSRLCEGFGCAAFTPEN